MGEAIVITPERASANHHHRQSRHRSCHGAIRSSGGRDIGLRNLDVVIGLETASSDIVDAVEGNCKLKNALIKDKRTEAFTFCRRPDEDKTAVSNEQRLLISELKEEFDMCDRLPGGHRHG